MGCAPELVHDLQSLILETGNCDCWYLYSAGSRYQAGSSAGQHSQQVSLMGARHALCLQYPMLHAEVAHQQLMRLWIRWSS
jgi:hypothetical protein